MAWSFFFFLSWWRQKSAVVVLQSYSSSSPRAFFRFSAPLTCASKGRERDAFVFVVDTSQDIFFFPFFLFSIVDTCQPTYKVRKSQIFLITKVVLFFLRNCTRQSAQCLKITEKVAFNIASEASYVYILSGKKLSKNAKNSLLWRIFGNLKIAVKQCYQTGHF